MFPTSADHSRSVGRWQTQSPVSITFSLTRSQHITLLLCHRHWLTIQATDCMTCSEYVSVEQRRRTALWVSHRHFRSCDATTRVKHAWMTSHFPSLSQALHLFGLVRFYEFLRQHETFYAHFTVDSLGLRQGWSQLILRLDLLFVCSICCKCSADTTPLIKCLFAH